MPPELLFDIRDATLMRGDAVVLDRVSLTIAPGDHTAILGPNGAGKSSLIRLMTVQDYPIAPEDGSSPVRVFGRDRWDVIELRSRLGIVSNELHDRFTGGTWIARVRGLDAVVSGFFSSQALFDHHLVTPAMLRRAEEALDRVGAAHLAGKRLDHMSTGEARRVLIARALVHEPEALILDEPTTGLDVVARHEFMERVRAVARQGVTLVLVTQHLDEIIPEIGRVVLIRHGRVAEDGPKADVLRGKAFEAAFGARLIVEEHDGYYDVRPRRS